MKTQHISIIRDILNHQIMDKDGKRIGKVDDIEFSKDTRSATALLTGPGIYTRGTPQFFGVILRWIAGSGANTISWKDIKEVGSSIILSKKAEQLGLGLTEEKTREWMKSITKL